MSPKKHERKIVWKSIHIENRLDTLTQVIERTRRQAPENKTRLLGKAERWLEQLDEVNDRIRYIKKTLTPKLEKIFDLKIRNKEILQAAMFQPSTKNLFLELDIQYRGKNNPFDDGGFEDLISLSESAKRFALLGDAAISMAVIYHLWQTVSEDVGQLTQDKSSIVSNEHMADLCDRWGLYEHRIHFDPETPSKGEIIHDKGTLVEAVYGIVQIEHGFDHVLKNIDHLL
ncbi:MAG: ribonuclease III domain-containing protein [Candidatus Thorarchaeota archaeon]